MIVLRPPPSDGNRTTIQLFLDEFTSFTKEFGVDTRKILIAGDFNFHVDVQSIVNAFDYTQFVKDLIHKHSHT